MVKHLQKYFKSKSAILHGLRGLRELLRGVSVWLRGWRGSKSYTGQVGRAGS